MEIGFREAQERDSERIAKIYNHYIRKTIISFEMEAISGGEMWERIKKVQEEHFWLVGERADGELVGYAYGSTWNSRCAYDRTLETSIYLAVEHLGKGYGKRLYGALIDRLKSWGAHSLIGGIALPNPASVAIHESLGYQKVAHYKEVGFKFNQWIDVGYWQLMLVVDDGIEELE